MLGRAFVTVVVIAVLVAVCGVMFRMFDGMVVTGS